ncbi:GNAT family N-acetyltransferase [Rhizobium sullae]|uniref:Ribosomal protein S18 acetylase RimI-like enzyme n=1 Tax=Rhizobium sullae TaxID=50338 RepID=A0A4R3Q9S6_RHISU|nr:GNAT family N-acetyltransferase [Rhizobium sullae]TCU18190.1 ribosomal protein S18 acetylase RimI-like enzyme [Rhizobium sullae]
MNLFSNRQMPATIRVALPSDATAIATVHVASWKETYDGLMPEAILAGLSVTELDQAEPNLGTTFVAEHDGSIVGFAHGADQRSPSLRDLGFTGEITGIYMLKSIQQQGIGTALMRATAEMLQARHYSAASLWVLRENTVARRFYDGLGGELVGEKEDRRGTMTLVEVAYGWRDLSPLL